MGGGKGEWLSQKVLVTQAGGLEFVSPVPTYKAVPGSVCL